MADFLGLDPYTVVIMLGLFGILAIIIAVRIDRFRPTCKVRYDTHATGCKTDIENNDKDY
jgi:hypothetical protein